MGARSFCGQLGNFPTHLGGKGQQEHVGHMD